MVSVSMTRGTMLGVKKDSRISAVADVFLNTGKQLARPTKYLVKLHQDLKEVHAHGILGRAMVELTELTGRLTRSLVSAVKKLKSSGRGMLIDNEVGLLRYRLTCNESLLRVEEASDVQEALDNFLANLSSRDHFLWSRRTRRLLKLLTRRMDPIRNLKKIHEKLNMVVAELSQLGKDMFHKADAAIRQQRRTLIQLHGMNVHYGASKSLVGKRSGRDIGIVASDLRSSGYYLKKHHLYPMQKMASSLLHSSEELDKSWGRSLNSQVGGLSEASVLIEAAGVALQKSASRVVPQVFKTLTVVKTHMAEILPALFLIRASLQKRHVHIAKRVKALIDRGVHVLGKVLSARDDLKSILEEELQKHPVFISSQFHSAKDKARTRILGLEAKSAALRSIGDRVSSQRLDDSARQLAKRAHLGHRKVIKPGRSDLLMIRQKISGQFKASSYREIRDEERGLAGTLRGAGVRKTALAFGQSVVGKARQGLRKEESKLHSALNRASDFSGMPRTVRDKIRKTKDIMQRLSDRDSRAAMLKGGVDRIKGQVDEFRKKAKNVIRLALNPKAEIAKHRKKARAIIRRISNPRAELEKYRKKAQNIVQRISNPKAEMDKLVGKANDVMAKAKAVSSRVKNLKSGDLKGLAGGLWRNSKPGKIYLAGKKTFGAFKGFAKSGFKSGGGALADAAGALGGAIGGKVGRAIGKVGDVIKLGKSVKGLLAGGSAGGWAAAGAALGAIIGGKVGRAVGTVASYAGKVIGALAGNPIAIIGLASDAAKWLGDKIGGPFGKLLSGIGSIVGKVIGKIGCAIAKIFGGCKTPSPRDLEDKMIRAVFAKAKISLKKVSDVKAIAVDWLVGNYRRVADGEPDWSKIRTMPPKMSIGIQAAVKKITCPKADKRKLNAEMMRLNPRVYRRSLRRMISFVGMFRRKRKRKDSKEFIALKKLAKKNVNPPCPRTLWRSHPINRMSAHVFVALARMTRPFAGRGMFGRIHDMRNRNRLKKAQKNARKNGLPVVQFLPSAQGKKILASFDVLISEAKKEYERLKKIVCASRGHFYIYFHYKTSKMSLGVSRKFCLKNQMSLGNIEETHCATIFAQTPPTGEERALRDRENRHFCKLYVKQKYPQCQGRNQNHANRIPRPHENRKRKTRAHQKRIRDRANRIRQQAHRRRQASQRLNRARSPRNRNRYRKHNRRRYRNRRRRRGNRRRRRHFGRLARGARGVVRRGHRHVRGVYRIGRHISRSIEH